jgi:putative sugar O-methyltransferase
LPVPENNSTLAMMLEDMATAPQIYKPTHYWEVLIPRVMKLIAKHGLKNIKHHPHFVPIYCSGTFRKHRNFYQVLSNIIGVVIPRGRVVRRGILNHLLGYNNALLDYKLFKSTDIESQAPILSNVSESEYGLEDDRPGFVFEFNGNKYSKGMLKYLKALAFLKRSVDTTKVTSVLEIGGGLAPLGEILHQAQGSDYFYVGVDIPPMAYLATDYLSHIHGSENVLDYSESRKMDVLDLDELRKSYSAVMLCPWQLPKVKGNLDLFVNSTSFQEMELDVVQNYANIATELVSSYVLINNKIVGQPVAVGVGRGVNSATTIDDIINCFNEFEVVERSTWLAATESELVVMSRKSNP